MLSWQGWVEWTSKCSKFVDPLYYNFSVAYCQYRWQGRNVKQTHSKCKSLTNAARRALRVEIKHGYISLTWAAFLKLCNRKFSVLFNSKLSLPAYVADIESMHMLQNWTTCNAIQRQNLPNHITNFHGFADLLIVRCICYMFAIWRYTLFRFPYLFPYFLPLSEQQHCSAWILFETKWFLHYQFRVSLLPH